MSTAFLERELASAMSRVSDYRQRHAMRLKADQYNPIVASAGGFAAPLRFAEQLSKNEEQYKHNCGWTFVAVNRIATKLAGQPIRMGRITDVPLDMGRLTSPKRRLLKSHQRAKAPGYIKQTESEIEIIEQHPLLEALKNPNKGMTAWGLLHNTISSLELTGRAFWWMPIVDGKLQIYYVPADYMYPVHDENDLYKSWVMRPPGTFGKEYPVPAEEVAYFCLPDPSDPLGSISPLQTQAPAVAVDEQIQVAQYRTFKNGIFPQVILRAGTVPSAVPGMTGSRPVLTSSQRKELIESILTVYEGSINYGEPLIIDGLIEGVDRLTQTPQEMDFINSGLSVRSRIMQAFGVNPIIAGEIVNVGRAQASVAQAIFYENVINPLACLIGQVMTVKLATEGLLFWIEEASPQDREQMLREWTVGMQSRVVTGNEFRTVILGLPPDEQFEGPPASQTPEFDFGALEPPPKPKPDEEEKPEEEEEEDEERSGKPMSKAKYRESVLRIWSKQVKQYEGLMTAAMKRFFGLQAKTIAEELQEVLERAPSLLNSPGSADQIASMIYRPKDWDAVLKKAATRPILRAMVAGYLAEHTMGKIRSGKLRTKDLSPEDVEWLQNWDIPQATKDRMLRALNETFEYDYWLKMNETTRETLKNLIGDAVTEGYSYRKLASMIHAEIGDSSGARSMNIARTEMGGALNAGHKLEIEESESFGITVDKEWMTAGDPDVRPTHQSLEGVTARGSDGLFDVGGYMVPYPSHPALPAGERANCRCVISGIVADDQEDLADAVAAR